MMSWFKKSVLAGIKGIGYVRGVRRNFVRWIRHVLSMRNIIEFPRPFLLFSTIKRRHMDEYQLRELNAGLLSEGTKDNEYIKDDDLHRIVCAYKKSKADQRHQPAAYQVGGFWEILSLHYHKDLVVALEKQDFMAIRGILKDFGVGKISIGLSLSGGLPTSFRGRIEWLNTFNINYYHWRRLTDLGVSPTGYAKEIGNLPGVERDGRIILHPSFRLSYFADRIHKLLIPKKSPVIVEIGGGYGGLPYHLFNEHDTNATYMDFDIPEVCVLASYLLMSSFPGKKFLLYGEQNLTDAAINKYDVIIMPNYAIKELSDRCSDIVFNSHSLTEMDCLTVKEYLHQIERIGIKYFLHANHELGANLPYDTPSGKVKTHVCLNDPEFELSKDTFKRVYRFPELIQNESPGCSDYTYFEYLYERIT